MRDSLHELLEDMHMVCGDAKVREGCDAFLDVLPDGSNWMAVGGYNYKYADHRTALADLMVIISNAQGDPSDWVAVSVFVGEELAGVDVTKAPGYDGDPHGDTMPRLVHSNEIVTPLVDFHSETPLVTRLVGDDPHSIYLAHPSLDSDGMPFIVKDSWGHDAGPRYRTIQEAVAFLDGLVWNKN